MKGVEDLAVEVLKRVSACYKGNPLQGNVRPRTYSCKLLDLIEVVLYQIRKLLRECPLNSAFDQLDGPISSEVSMMSLFRPRI